MRFDQVGRELTEQEGSFRLSKKKKKKENGSSRL